MKNKLIKISVKFFIEKYCCNFTFFSLTFLLLEGEIRIKIKIFNYFFLLIYNEYKDSATYQTNEMIMLRTVVIKLSYTN